MNKKVIGVPSGDYECFCFDVTEETYKQSIGKKPREFDESYFYENLYQQSDVPNVPIWNKQYNNPSVLLEVEYNDYGIVSIKETDIPLVIKNKSEDDTEMLRVCPKCNTLFQLDDMAYYIETGQCQYCHADIFE